MAEPISLHKAAKTIVDQFGQDTLKTLRFANLISDLRGYDEYPATQKILKDILTKGYGDKILTKVSTTSKKKVPSGCQQFIAVYKQSSGYKEDLVTYIFDCLFFALGCVNHVNKPFSNGYQAQRTSSDDILGCLKDNLDKYKKQYVDEMDKHIVLPVDILFDAPAYFTAHSLNVLYGIEAKINVLQDQLGQHNTSWCQNQLSAYLEARRKEKHAAVKNELKKDKDNYLSMLLSLSTKPGGGIIKRSYYFNSDAEEQLSKAEDRIKKLYHNIPKTYDDWCEHEKEKILKKYSVTSNDVIKQFIYKIAVPATIISLISFTGINYATSIDEINRFEQTINEGNQKLEQGDYAASFALFQKAKLEYDGGWRKSSYKESAQEEINKGVDLLISNCEGALYTKEYGKANYLLTQLPENIIEKGSKEEEALKVIKENISSAVDTEMDNLVENISKNNGKLDGDGKKLLDNLLKLSPDNYWLNFIKNKQ